MKCRKLGCVVDLEVTAPQESQKDLIKETTVMLAGFLSLHYAGASQGF